MGPAFELDVRCPRPVAVAVVVVVPWSWFGPGHCTAVSPEAIAASAERSFTGQIPTGRSCWSHSGAAAPATDCSAPAVGGDARSSRGPAAGADRSRSSDPRGMRADGAPELGVGLVALSARAFAYRIRPRWNPPRCSRVPATRPGSSLTWQSVHLRVRLYLVAAEAENGTAETVTGSTTWGCSPDGVPLGNHPTTNRSGNARGRGVENPKAPLAEPGLSGSSGGASGP